MLRTVMATVAATLCLTAVGTGPVHADPLFAPPENSLVAVGDETTQYLANAFSINYNAGNPVNQFYSWDAVGSAYIQTKQDSNPSPCVFYRPNGANLNLIGTATKDLVPGRPYGYGCVDMVMSSRSLTTLDPAWLTSVVFARDLITWSTDAGGNAVANLTDQELRAIYSCDATQLPAGDVHHVGPVSWHDLTLEGGVSPDAILPVLPQAYSGTRAQWLKDLGVNASGYCMANGSWNGNVIEDNEGVNGVFTPAGGTNEWKDVIFPYSAGMYVCQLYTKNCPDQHGGLVLGEIDGKAPLTATSPPMINTGALGLFPSLYVRNLSAVVRNGGSQAVPLVATPNTAGAQWPVNPTQFLGQGNNTGWICSAPAQVLVVAYGFARAGSACGKLVNSTVTPLPAPAIP